MGPLILGPALSFRFSQLGSNYLDHFLSAILVDSNILLQKGTTNSWKLFFTASQLFNLLSNRREILSHISLLDQDYSLLKNVIESVRKLRKVKRYLYQLTMATNAYVLHTYLWPISTIKLWEKPIHISTVKNLLQEGMLKETSSTKLLLMRSQNENMNCPEKLTRLLKGFLPRIWWLMLLQPLKD